MIVSLGLAFLAVLLTGISQILLKIGSEKGKGTNDFLAPYMNAPAFLSYGVLLLVTVISVIALREIPLKLLYAITSLNFAVVAIMSPAILGEKIGRSSLFAILLIMIGIIVFYLM